MTQQVALRCHSRVSPTSRGVSTLYFPPAAITHVRECCFSTLRSYVISLLSYIYIYTGVTLNTPNNLEHVRIFIPRAQTLGIPETPEHHMLGTDRYVGDSSHLSSTRKVHLSSTGKVHVYITRKSIFPLTRKSIFPLTRKSIRLLEILHKNVLCLRDHRNVVVKPRWWLAFAHRSTQIGQYVWRDRRGVRLGDAITQRKRRIITFWR